MTERRIEKNKYDVVIIGGGPAGMIAAGRAAEKGAKVIILEKNKRLGEKLLITGKGRCNITHGGDDHRTFIESFGKNGRFLYSALNVFDIEDTLHFFNSRGCATKLERGNRIFPVSDRAMDVLQVLIDYLKEWNVTIKYNSAVLDIVADKNRISKIVLEDREIFAKSVIICTGGLSYPATGSTGDGFTWTQKIGHTIVDLKPSLVPVDTHEKWISELAGLSLKNVRIDLFLCE